MKRRLTSSLIAFGFVAAVVFGYAKLAKKVPPKAASGAPGVGAFVQGVVSRPAPDPCANVADRCACAAEHGSSLLAASFPARALQLLARSAGECHAPASEGPRAEALAVAEQAVEAKRVASEVLKSEPQNRFARRALAIVAMQATDFTSCDATLAELVKEDPKDVDSLYYQALAQRRREHYNGAREGFLRVLRLDAQHIDARYQLVTLTATAGAQQEAEHDLQELSQIAPKDDPRTLDAQAVLQRAKH